MFSKLFYFIISNTLLTLSSGQYYNEPLVKTALNISQAAYCLTPTSTWDCKTCSQDNIYEGGLFEDGEQILFGYNTKFDAVFVGFRGSSNIQNWVDNLQVSHITPYSDTNIKVEKGFYHLYMELQNDILQKINELTIKYHTNNLLITGHSLGAALSTLCVFDLTYVMHSRYTPIVITFGSPRVGNTEFVNQFMKFGFYANRITHWRDVVPHVPQELLDYQHIPQEIWYSENNDEYTICNDYDGDESESCSNTCAPLHCTSIDDHLNYLHIQMGADGDC